MVVLGCLHHTTMIQTPNTTCSPEYHGIQLKSLNEKEAHPKHIPIASKKADSEELVDIALHQLQVAGFELIYGERHLYIRMGVPLILKVIDFLCNARYVD